MEFLHDHCQRSDITVSLNGGRPVKLDNNDFLKGTIALQYAANPPSETCGGVIKWRKVLIKKITR